MNKILFAILVVIVGGVLLLNWVSASKRQNQQAISSSSSGLPAYSMLNMKMTSGGRDFSVKAVMEFPDQQTCERSKEKAHSLLSGFKDVCKATTGCQQLSDSPCNSYVEDRYLSLLNQQKSDIYYLHLRGSYKERGVIVFWGLNSDEAKHICEKGQEDITRENRYKQDANDKVTASCVTPA